MAIKIVKRYALVNPIMPLYRYGVYKELSCIKDIQFDFYSDTKEINGIKNIQFELSKIKVEEGGLRWYRIKVLWFHFRKVYVFIWYSHLIKIVVRKKYDGIIFVESGHSPANWIFPIIARLFKKHVIFWGHGYYGNENKLKSIFRLTYIKLAHDFLLYGHNAKKLLVEKGIGKGKLNVVYNSLDYNSQLKYRVEITKEMIDLKRNQLFNKPGFPIILFIGRLEFNKKIIMLLEAALEMKNGGLNTNVLIIGDGPEKGNLIKFSNDNHLDNVCFYGKCYEEKELALLITLSDVSVSPGNVGLNCIHSLMYGTPMITHDNIVFQMPEVEAIIPGINGDLYEFGNQQDLTLKLRNWIVTKSKNSGIVENCYSVIDEKYNPKNQAEIITSVIRKRWQDG